MILIKSISKCGQCTKSTCRNCSNYLGVVQPSEDLDTHRAFFKAVSFVLMFTILFILI